jgi:GntR family transcriptional regulator
VVDRLNRRRYQQRRQTPVRANDSVRRTYDLLRAALPTLEPQTVLVEDDLADRMSASRNTVRVVLRLLAAQGLVSRSPKVGTVVRDSTVLRLDELMPIAEWGAHHAIHGQVLESFVIPAPAMIGQRLGLEERSPLAVLETLILEEITPIALTVSYAGWPSGIEDYPSKEPDILSFLEENLELCVSGSDLTLSAVTSDAQTASLLQINEDEPVLFVEDLLCDRDETPRALCQTRFRGDRVTLSAKARRRGATPRD